MSTNPLDDALMDNLAKVFNTEPMIVEVVDNVPVVVEKQGTEEIVKLDQDFEKTTNNIQHLMSKANSALESAVSLATSSESPRAIEALSTLLKTISDINNGYLDAHVKVAQIKSKKSLKGVEETPTGNPTQINNTLVFNGTTKELKEILKKERNSLEND